MAERQGWQTGRKTGREERNIAISLNSCANFVEMIGEGFTSPS